VANEHGKLSRGVLRSLDRARRGERIGIIVRFRSDAPVYRHGMFVRGASEGYRFRLRPFIQMRANYEAIRALEQDPSVLRIYHDQPVHAFLDEATSQIQLPLVWDAGWTAEGVRVAVIDTGIDADHPDLAGRVVDTIDVTGEGPQDENGHGTHCASILAGTGAASGGKYRGAAPGALIYSAKVLDRHGQGMMSDVMEGIEWAVDQGVQVISLSLGGSGSSDGADALSEICDAAVEQGVVVCVAAGNDGPGSYTIGSPGAARLPITVGACNELDRIASFSSRGPTADGRAKPDIVLPGVNITAARARGTTLGDIVDDHYTTLSGTSMATPLAAGICALLLHAEPDLTPEAIKERLRTTAIDLGADVYAQGTGRADAWRALQEEQSPSLPEPTPPTPGPVVGGGCLTLLLQLLIGGKKR